MDGIKPMYTIWGASRLYDSFSELTFLGHQRRIRGAAVERLAVGPEDAVLDLGCGTGLNLPLIHRLVGAGGRIVALDYTPAMLARAEARCSRAGMSNVVFVQGDAAQVDPAIGPFQGIISTLALSVIPRWEVAIARAVATLASNGRFVILDGAHFEGPWRVINPLERILYRPFACWDPDRDLVGCLADHLTDVRVERFNGGSLFVAHGRKL